MPLDHGEQNLSPLLSVSCDSRYVDATRLLDASQRCLVQAMELMPPGVNDWIVIMGGSTSSSLGKLLDEAARLLGVEVSQRHAGYDQSASLD